MIQNASFFEVVQFCVRGFEYDRLLKKELLLWWGNEGEVSSYGLSFSLVFPLQCRWQYLLLIKEICLCYFHGQVGDSIPHMHRLLTCWRKIIFFCYLFSRTESNTGNMNILFKLVIQCYRNVNMVGKTWINLIYVDYNILCCWKLKLQIIKRHQ